MLTWTRVQADPYDESQREKAEEEIWAFPQDLYGRYKSATLHTAKKDDQPTPAGAAIAQALRGRERTSVVLCVGAGGA